MRPNKELTGSKFRSHHDYSALSECSHPASEKRLAVSVWSLLFIELFTHFYRLLLVPIKPVCAPEHGSGGASKKTKEMICPAKSKLEKERKKIGGVREG